MKLWFILFCSFVLSASSLFGLELPDVFGDKAILQCEQNVPVWGTAQPGEKVQVSFGGQTVSAKADDRGSWRVELAPLEASVEGKDLVVTGEKETLKRVDILVGEVWLCAGQSNMSALGDRTTWTRTGELADMSSFPNPLVRLFSRTQRLTPAERLAGKVELGKSEWVVPERNPNLPMRVAVMLQNELKVPIGVIKINLGGTKIFPWLRESLKIPQKVAQRRDDVREKLNMAIKDIEAGGDAGELGGYIIHQRQGSIDKLNVEPVVGYALRGFLWYQGESNAKDYKKGIEPVLYTDCMELLVNDWRERWKKPLPFHYVQIATDPKPAGPVRKWRI
ncbi:sialate O-acetylesterase [Verrucomicrobiota bacterium]